MFNRDLKDDPLEIDSHKPEFNEDPSERYGNEGSDERPPIDEEKVRNAEKILADYKAAKQNFDAHVIAAEEWWRMRHWDELNAKDGESASEKERGEIDARSAWLLAQIESKKADFMDSIPTFAALPREAADEASAKMLSSVLPVIFEQNDFEQVYHDVSESKIKHGTGIYGVFWDPDRARGLGDISIKDIDCLNLFWEAGISDIQDSENIFYVTKLSRDALTAAYPDKKEKLIAGGVSGTVEEYRSDDYVDNWSKIEVVDWYYKKNGILHYCKFAAGTVLEATENYPKKYPCGLYAHGLYPFFVDVYYSVKNSPGGFGLIDTQKSEQEQIDRTARAMVKNVLGSSKQKTYISTEAGVNKDDIADPDVEIVEFTGVLRDDTFRTIQPNSNADMYMSVISQKVAQMKETSGNQDVNSGNAPAGVTAASAIAALQEQAGKTSRSKIKDTYRVFVRITKCVIELIREFYTLPRTFRITGKSGANEYVSFSNQNMPSRSVKLPNGDELNFEPDYDVIVTAQKATAYSAMAQNELALEFYKGGFFEPQRADQALAALEMMDFRGKEKMRELITQNGTMYQQLMALSERLAKAEAALGLGNMTVNAASSQGETRNIEIPKQNADGVVSGESSITKKARERAAEVAQPR